MNAATEWRTDEPPLNTTILAIFKDYTDDPVITRGETRRTVKGETIWFIGNDRYHARPDYWAHINHPEGEDMGMTYIGADYVIDRLFSVRDDGCLAVSSFHKSRFVGTPDEWNLLVSCVEDNITDDGAIDSEQAARDYQVARERCNK